MAARRSSRWAKEPTRNSGILAKIWKRSILNPARRALNLSWIGGIYDCIVAREKLRKLMALFVIACRVHQFHNFLFGGLIFALRLVKFLSGCQQVKSLREFVFLIFKFEAIIRDIVDRKKRSLSHKFLNLVPQSFQAFYYFVVLVGLRFGKFIVDIGPSATKRSQSTASAGS